MQPQPSNPAFNPQEYPVMVFRNISLLAALLLTASLRVHAGDITGRWTSEFDSQIGIQKYVFEFKTEGDKITGKATHDHSMGKGEAVLKDIKVSGDDVSFAEPMSFDGNELIITYTGKLAGDEIKLTRVVGDFATEQIVAKRAKAPEAKPAATK